MAIRDRLIARCQKYLPPNTQVRHVFRCARGQTYSFSVIAALLTMFDIEAVIVAVTADAVFVAQA